MLDLGAIARALGGKVKGDPPSHVRAPGPGHSPKDDSLSVKLDPTAPDGFVVNSFAGDDPITCRDYVRERCGLGAFVPQARKPRTSPAEIRQLMQEAVAATAEERSAGGVLTDTYSYRDEAGAELYQVLRYASPKTFRQRRPNGKGDWIWNLNGVRRVLYRLRELLEYPDATVFFFCEGEKDADGVASLKLCATTVAGGHWTEECVQALAGRDVMILEDNDDAGRKKAHSTATQLHGIAKTVRIVRLPGLTEREDVSDWLDTNPHNADKLADICFATPLWDPPEQQNKKHSPPNESAARSEQIQKADDAEEDTKEISFDDFYAFMDMHNYLYISSRALWPASSVDARLPPQPLLDRDGNPILDKHGNPKLISASHWLDQNRHIEQITWWPGMPMLIQGRVISEGGWIKSNKDSCFNLYRPPTIKLGDKAKADRWLEHVHKVFPEEADHIVVWLAHRVQRPQDKINHAVVLGGLQGIGKDTLLEPVKRAVGPWNFAEVSPQHIFGNFNGFLKSVILRVSEARDLGREDRFKFYDHMKAYTAAPPDVLRVNEKHLREYYVPNLCGTIITTNHKTDGIYLPMDDRRHYVAWSILTKQDFNDKYWDGIWGWYDNGGDSHVAAYLTALDISSFNAKAPPPKTAAFWDIVDANRAPEDAELADVLDRIGNPDAVTLIQITDQAPAEFLAWITDRKNRRQIPYRMEQCGYIPVRNETAKDGLWKINDKRQVIYAKSTLSIKERIAAAERLAQSE
jgi:hypothetical protein